MKLLTTEQAVEFLKNEIGYDTTINTLSTLRYRGGGPKFIKVGRKARYSPEHLREWVSGRTQVLSNTAQAA